MDRVNAILRHPLFIVALEHLECYEKDRVFCGHGMDHLLDVARIAHAISLESDQRADKELLYAAALLHDIGRLRQYEDRTPHERESACIAAKILPECGFEDVETELIVDAILSHRTQSREKHGFAGYIYRADKLSRRCWECAADSDCNWEMKNTRLEY